MKMGDSDLVNSREVKTELMDEFARSFNGNRSSQNEHFNENLSSSIASITLSDSSTACEIFSEEEELSFETIVPNANSTFVFEPTLNLLSISTDDKFSGPSAAQNDNETSSNRSKKRKSNEPNESDVENVLTDVIKTQNLKKDNKSKLFEKRNGTNNLCFSNKVAELQFFNICLQAYIWQRSKRT